MLHTCFGYSTAGSLRQMLKAAGRDETVLTTHDNLAAGPIAEVTGQGRKYWFLAAMKMEDGSEGEFWKKSTEYWGTICQAFQTEQVMVWLSRRCTFEVAWFSHLMSLLPGSTRFQLADMTQESKATSHEPFLPAVSLGVLNPQDLRHGLEIAKSVSADDFSSDIENWKQLQSENAPLRVFSGMKLVSAPADYFDATLIKHASKNWQPAARIVGATLVDQQIQPGTAEVSDIWLFARLWHLVETGRFEADGIPLGPRVRLRLKA